MGLRIVKSAVASVLSIYLATALGLHSPNSTGLLSILGVEVTKKRGLIVSLKRIGASLLGLFIASLLYKVFGFHAWVVGIYIMTAFPLLSRLNLSQGIVTSSVVMFHLLLYQSTSLPVILNEVYLLLLGLGTATVINLIYMPKADQELLDVKGQVEELFSSIFTELAGHLKDEEHIWDGKELLEVSERIEKGLKLAERSKENALIFGDHSWITYFVMRQQQLDIIHHMVDLTAQVSMKLPQAERLIYIFEELSKDVKSDYYTGRCEQALKEMGEIMRNMPLPADRVVFEVRSALLQLRLELLNYLSIAKKKKKKQGRQEN